MTILNTFNANSFSEFDWKEIKEYILAQLKTNIVIKSNISGTHTYTLNNAQIITCNYKGWPAGSYQQGDELAYSEEKIKDEFAFHSLSAVTESYTTNDKLYNVKSAKSLQAELIEIIFFTEQ